MFSKLILTKAVGIERFQRITFSLDRTLMAHSATIKQLLYSPYTKQVELREEIKIHTAMREKCPNTEFFLVRVLIHSDWIRRDTEYLSVSSPNAGKYEPEKALYLDTFHAVQSHPFNTLAKFSEKLTSKKFAYVLDGSLSKLEK